MLVGINNQLQFNNPNFASKTSIPDFSTFKRNYHQRYREIPIDRTLHRITSRKENIIGKGSSKTVFKIQNLQDFVVALIPSEIKKIPVRIKKLHPLRRMNKMNFKFNFGQPIACDNNGTYILMKARGKSHSLDNWNKRLEGIVLGDKPVTNQEAEEFLKETRMISGFSQSAYDNFAEQLVYLNEQDIKIDMINANNLLVDKKRQHFTPIDIDYNSKNYRKLKRPLNTVNDMINILLDAVLHRYIYKQLDESSQKELFDFSNLIIKKCCIAGQKYGLLSDDSNVKYVYRFMDKVVAWRKKQDLQMLKSYNEFAKMYDIKNKPLC